MDDDAGGGDVDDDDDDDDDDAWICWADDGSIPNLFNIPNGKSRKNESIKGLIVMDSNGIPMD